RGVGLVDGADRVDARGVLRDARAVAEAGRAGVAGARDDLAQSVAHGALDSSETRAPGQAKACRGTRLLRYEDAGPSGCTVHVQPLRPRPRSNPGELRGAHAALADRPHGRDLARPPVGRPRASS